MTYVAAAFWTTVASAKVVRRPGVIVLALCVIAAPSCRRQTDPAPSPANASTALREVALPDLSPVDESVQGQIRELHATLQSKQTDPATPPADLGAAFGELAILLHAAEYYEAAKPAYLNAQSLMPQDARWPYYLGHLARSEGDAAASIDAFRRALELNPSDMPTLVWLGRAYLEQGQPDTAAPMFEKALSVAPQTVAALAGLGQAALDRKDYARAAQVLEQALSINPGVASLHSPLAMAYRGLGDTAKADAHLKQWRNTDILVPDPLRQQLDLALQSGLSYELRGVRALEQRDFTAAEALFRKGIELQPGNTGLSRSLKHKLGTALALQGDIDGAVAQFRDVARLAPADEQDEPAAKAHYSLGVLEASAGTAEAAVRHLTAALRYNPNYLEARLALGDVRRRNGRFAESLTQYQEALKIDPRASDARFGYAMALVRLGRYREARDWLDEAMRIQLDRPEFAHALARILAAAPDPAVRNGARARELVSQLFAAGQSADLGETMAMVAAEQGDFPQAVAIQRETLDAARQGGTPADIARITANLRLYEKGQPNRVPWPADHPVHRPGG